MRALKVLPFITIIVIVTLASKGIPFVNAQENNQVDLFLFYGQGCPHCAGMIGFLDEMESEYPQLNVQKYEVYFQKENIPLFQLVAQKYGGGIDAVPTAFVGGKNFVGFSNEIGRLIRSEIERCLMEECVSPMQYQEPKPEEVTPPVVQNTQVVQDVPPVIPPKEITDENIDEDISEEQEIDVKENDEDKETNFAATITIPAVIGAAVVDAINPCAFAVLIILITTVLSSGKKKRALLSGFAFSLSIFISYFLMGLGLYSAIQASGLTHKFYTVIAVLAIFIGLFNLKDYLWYGKWFVMEVPMSWRPKLKALIMGVTSVPGAFFIGFAVSLFLLPCTSGPYIVILGLLAHTTTKSYALFLLAFYNLIFISPMIIITGAVYFGLTTTEQAEEWRTKKLKILHLIAGLIILGLGITMLCSLWLGYI